MDLEPIKDRTRRLREFVMTCFSVGDRVVIRWGSQKGQKAKIIGSQPGDAYKVRIEDGSVLYFTGKGLEMETQGLQQVVF